MSDEKRGMSEAETSAILDLVRDQPGVQEQTLEQKFSYLNDRINFLNEKLIKLIKLKPVHSNEEYANTLDELIQCELVLCAIKCKDSYKVYVNHEFCQIDCEAVY